MQMYSVSVLDWACLKHYLCWAVKSLYLHANLFFYKAHFLYSNYKMPIIVLPGIAYWYYQFRLLFILVRAKWTLPAVSKIKDKSSNTKRKPRAQDFKFPYHRFRPSLLRGINCLKFFSFFLWKPWTFNCQVDGLSADDSTGPKYWPM